MNKACPDDQNSTLGALICHSVIVATLLCAKCPQRHSSSSTVANSAFSHTHTHGRTRAHVKAIFIYLVCITVFKYLGLGAVIYLVIVVLGLWQQIKNKFRCQLFDVVKRKFQI